MAAEPLVDLSQVLDLTQSLIERVRPEQAGLPTPCRSWDVRALVAHLVNDTGQFTAAATGGRPDWDAPAPEIGDDWASAFRAGATELRAAWQRAGDLSQEIDLPIGRVPKSFVASQQVAEFAVHSWDLATATARQSGDRLGVPGRRQVVEALTARLPSTEKCGSGPCVAIA
jgi:uncharacterized protein (TIGR03086 family)